MPGIDIIMRHEAQLRQASRQINEARSIINSSKDACNNAAMQLLASWEGSAADAFAAEQLNFTSWIARMLAVIEEIVNFIDNANNAYTAVDQAVKNIITSK